MCPLKASVPHNFKFLYFSKKDAPRCVVEYCFVFESYSSNLFCNSNGRYSLSIWANESSALYIICVFDAPSRAAISICSIRSLRDRFFFLRLVLFGKVRQFYKILYCDATYKCMRHLAIKLALQMAENAIWLLFSTTGRAAKLIITDRNRPFVSSKILPKASIATSDSSVMLATRQIETWTSSRSRTCYFCQAGTRHKLPWQEC